MLLTFTPLGLNTVVNGFDVVLLHRVGNNSITHSLLDNAPNYIISWVHYPNEMDVHMHPLKELSLLLMHFGRKSPISFAHFLFIKYALQYNREFGHIS